MRAHPICQSPDAIAAGRRTSPLLHFKGDQSVMACGGFLFASRRRQPVGPFVLLLTAMANAFVLLLTLLGHTHVLSLTSVTDKRARSQGNQSGKDPMLKLFDCVKGGR